MFVLSAAAAACAAVSNVPAAAPLLSIAPSAESDPDFPPKHSNRIGDSRLPAG